MNNKFWTGFKDVFSIFDIESLGAGFAMFIIWTCAISLLICFLALLS